MSTYDETVALCALNKLFGYHPRQALALMERHGSAAALFDGSLGRAAADAPEKAPTPLAAAMAGLVPSTLEWAEKELKTVTERGQRFVCITDDDYPAALRECADPPLGLYLRGSSSPTEVFGLRPMIAFVGTRDLSPYGREWGQRLVRVLADARVQPCIVSGLAYGADAVAHRTALECGLPTVGVMATGVDKVYPYHHTELAAAMASAPGSGLVTDYPLGTSPVALNFMRRNRIIAGLVSAVVVIESKTRGGSLMTAKYACDYARDVFAVPGRLDDVRSAGCNSLIASEMARIIPSAEALPGLLGLGAPVRGAGGSWRQGVPLEERLRKALERQVGGGTGSGTDGGTGSGTDGGTGGQAASAPSAALQVALALPGHRGATPDELSALLGLPCAEVLAAIGLLEAAGIVTTDLLRRCSLAPGWT